MELTPTLPTLMLSAFWFTQEASISTTSPPKDTKESNSSAKSSNLKKIMEVPSKMES